MFVQSLVVVARMFAKSRRQKLADQVLERRFPVMKILTDPAYYTISHRPDTRTGSSTKMAYFPNSSHVCTHPDNGEHIYTVPAGKFMECLYCGTVWKAEKYPVAVNHGNKKDPNVWINVEAIFWNHHGTRKKPGDKIDRSAPATSASSSYVPRSSSARRSRRSPQAGLSEQAPRRATSVRRAREPSSDSSMKVEEVDSSWERPPRREPKESGPETA